MAYSDFLARTENGVTIQIPVDELLRILLSGQMPDGTTYAGVGIAGAAGSTYDVSDRPARDIGKVDIAAFDVALPAGTNLLGTVGVDQTTPGTTNRVAVGSALSGPGDPTIDSYTTVKIDLAASTANQVLVAAPGAGKAIWVYGLFMMADTAAGTVVLQDEDDTALTGTMAVSDEGGWVLAPSGNFAMPWLKCTTAKALEADTGACTIDGLLCYAVVTV